MIEFWLHNFCYSREITFMCIRKFISGNIISNRVQFTWRNLLECGSMSWGVLYSCKIATIILEMTWHFSNAFATVCLNHIRGLTRPSDFWPISTILAWPIYSGHASDGLLASGPACSVPQVTGLLPVCGPMSCSLILLFSTLSGWARPWGSWWKSSLLSPIS